MGTTILTIISLLVTEAVPIKAQSTVPTDTVPASIPAAVNQLYLPLVTVTGLRFEEGWSAEAVRGKELIVSKTRLDHVSAATTNQDTMTLVATTVVSGETVFIFIAAGGPVAIAALGLGVLIIIGIDTFSDDYPLIGDGYFSFSRKMFFPTGYSLTGEDAIPEFEVESQQIVIDWKNQLPNLEWLAIQNLSLVDAAMEPFIATGSKMGEVRVNGELRFIITLNWAQLHWQVRELSPVATVLGWKAMNEIIYKTMFNGWKPWIPSWVKTNNMIAADTDIPVFVRPGYTLKDTTDKLSLQHQGVAFGKWDDQGNPYYIDPVGVAIINGAPMLMYLFADIAADVPDEEPVTGWAAMEKRVQEIRVTKTQDIDPARPPSEQEETGKDDIPDLPFKKYRACPAWDPRVETITTKDMARHPEPSGARSAYYHLMYGLPAKYGGWYDAKHGVHKSTFLGYFSVYPPNEPQGFMGSGVGRWSEETINGVEVRIWAIQVWKFNNIRRKDESLINVYGWYQASTYWRTMSDSPFSEHMKTLWKNRPTNPPQYTGLCGYFEN
ncbi:hypothetical protein BH09PAT2_BH09PAT2_03030 [soil metagenome]